MAEKRIALENARFLDHARRPSQVDRTVFRELGELLFTACYEDLGKKPSLLEAEDVHGLLETILPARLRPKDPRIDALGAVFDAWWRHQEETEVVIQAFEVRQAFADGIETLEQSVRSGENAERQFAKPDAPFVHRAEKLGRNDPCSCGSGKKFKKCHGKGL